MRRRRESGRSIPRSPNPFVKISVSSAFDIRCIGICRRFLSTDGCSPMSSVTLRATPTRITVEREATSENDLIVSATSRFARCDSRRSNSSITMTTCVPMSSIVVTTWSGSMSASWTMSARRDTRASTSPVKPAPCLSRTSRIRRKTFRQSVWYVSVESTATRTTRSVGKISPRMFAIEVFPTPRSPLRIACRPTSSIVCARSSS
jgi:hypothetical protein